jgi:hypothetical protein
MVDKNKDNMTIATHMFGLPGIFFTVAFIYNLTVVVGLYSLLDSHTLTRFIFKKKNFFFVCVNWNQSEMIKMGTHGN